MCRILPYLPVAMLSTDLAGREEYPRPSRWTWVFRPAHLRVGFEPTTRALEAPRSSNKPTENSKVFREFTTALNPLILSFHGSL